MNAKRFVLNIHASFTCIRSVKCPHFERLIINVSLFGISLFCITPVYEYNSLEITHTLYAWKLNRLPFQNCNQRTYCHIEIKRV